MTAKEIRSAIDSGKRVYLCHSNYEVIKDDKNQYLIKCISNKSCIGLTHADNETLNGSPEQFILQTEFVKNQIIEELKKGKEPYEIFCINSANGRYIGEILQEYAIENGWEGFNKNREVLKLDDLSNEDRENGNYEYAYDEAEEYLNKHIAPDGYYFGSNENTSDYGLWKIEEEEEPKAQPEVIEKIVKTAVENSVIQFNNDQKIEVILDDCLEEIAFTIIEDNIEILSYNDSEEVEKELKDQLEKYVISDEMDDTYYFYSLEVAELRTVNQLLKERIEELSKQVESLTSDLNFYEREKDNRPTAQTPS